jgi:hypothetical protein
MRLNNFKLSIVSLILFSLSISKADILDDKAFEVNLKSVKGSVLIDPQTCGTLSAVVSIIRVNEVANESPNIQYVSNQGNFDFLKTQDGARSLSAQAGACYVSASSIGPISFGDQGYRICLTLNPYFCFQNGYY